MTQLRTRPHAFNVENEYINAAEMLHVARCPYYQAGSVDLCCCPRDERLRAARAAYRGREVAV